MAKVRIIAAEDSPFVQARDQVDPREYAPGSPKAEEIIASQVRYHHPGSDRELQMFEVEMTPNSEVKSHAHTEDEIIVVVEGELRVGKQTLRAGSSVYVPGETLYGFKVGPSGVRYLNFRPRQDRTYWGKEAFMTRRAEARAQEPLQTAP
jgi:quercetin dioxygenase-like cupin family protein